jgi:diguanylate cyclase (GGDEF)-like protein
MVHYFFDNDIVWSLGLVAANLLLLVLSGWSIRGRLLEVGQARRALLARQQHVLQLAQENAAHCFQVQWLRALSQSTRDTTGFFQLLRSSAGSPAAWQALLLTENGLTIAEPGTAECQLQIHLTAQGWRRLCEVSPVRLSMARQELYSTSPELAPGEFWACACGADPATSRVLLLTHLPRVTGDNDLDRELVSRLCRDLENHSQMHAHEADRSALEDAALVRDMLELRMLTDEDFASPDELLKQFLHKLAFMTNFERASIYRQRPETPCAEMELLAASAMVLPTEIHARWLQCEAEWSAIQLQKQIPLAWCPDLLDAGGDSLIQSALLVRITHAQFPTGILILTSRQKVVRSEYDVELAKWSAQFLPEMFHRASTWAQIEDRARRDALTGLANRHVFETNLQTFARHDGQACPGNSLLLLDLDHFKSINDQHGHLVGDEVLRSVASMIQRCVHQSRITDQPTVARYGGEEFAVLLPGVSLAGARRIAEQILQQLRSQPIVVPVGELRVTASIGIAGSPDHGQAPREWLQAADDALYAAKRSGRNRIEMAELRPICQSSIMSGASA